MSHKGRHCSALHSPKNVKVGLLAICNCMQEAKKPLIPSKGQQAASLCDFANPWMKSWPYQSQKESLHGLQWVWISPQSFLASIVCLIGEDHQLFKLLSVWDSCLREWDCDLSREPLVRQWVCNNHNKMWSRPCVLISSNTATVSASGHLTLCWGNGSAGCRVTSSASCSIWMLLRGLLSKYWPRLTLVSLWDMTVSQHKVIWLKANMRKAEG